MDDPTARALLLVVASLFGCSATPTMVVREDAADQRPDQLALDKGVTTDTAVMGSDATTDDVEAPPDVGAPDAAAMDVLPSRDGAFDARVLEGGADASVDTADARSDGTAADVERARPVGRNDRRRPFARGDIERVEIATHRRLMRCKRWRDRRPARLVCPS